MPNKEFFTLREISEMYSLPLSTLRRWSSERRFPIYKISNRVLVSAAEWKAWLEESHCNPSRPNLSLKEKLVSKK